VRDLRVTHRVRAAVACGLVTVAAASVVACGGDEDSGGSAGGGGGGAEFTLGLSTPFLSTPFFVVMNDLVEREAQQRGIPMLEPTNANQDAGKQITDVRNLIDAGAEGILAGLVDAGAIAPALQYAQSQDVPVVVVDDKPSAGKVYMTVRADNEALGQKACEYMGPKLEDGDKVLSLQGDQATTNGRDRTTGFNECMQSQFPDIEVVERPTKWQTPQAANQTQTALTANPDLKGIYMQSDSVMLSAVLQVLRRAGKATKVGAANHITLVSVDGTPPALEAIRDGWLDAAVSQPLDGYAKYGVEHLQNAVAGRPAEVGPTDHGSRIVRDENGNLMDLLPAPLVTEENADDESLWGNAVSELNR
jgi:ABC-type sugar transport system substrate-binding protein